MLSLFRQTSSKGFHSQVFSKFVDIIISNVFSPSRNYNRLKKAKQTGNDIRIMSGLGGAGGIISMITFLF